MKAMGDRLCLVTTPSMAVLLLRWATNTVLANVLVGPPVQEFLPSDLILVFDW